MDAITQKITPCLWFDHQAEEAAQFYVSLFENSKITNTNYYSETGYEVHHMEAGTVLTVSFELGGQHFLALNGGPHFKFSPAVSFLVYCDTENEVDTLFKPLSNNGKIMMPLQEYSFSKKYAWVEDRYGLSWQLYLGASQGPKIVPTLMFCEQQSGNAEAAMQFYTSVFANARIGDISRYDSDDEPDVEGTIRHASFWLEGQEFAAMDSKRAHGPGFNEALSLVINCENQGDVNHYWEKLSKNGDKNAQQCGWLKDKYGFSWQVVPVALGKMLSNRNTAKSDRVMEAMLQMKKLDLPTLERAYNNDDTSKSTLV